MEVGKALYYSVQSVGKMLLSGSNANMRRSESSNSLRAGGTSHMWDSSDPSRNPAPLPLPDYAAGAAVSTANVKRDSKIAAAHRKLATAGGEMTPGSPSSSNLHAARDSAEAAGVLELCQSIHRNLELLIKRSQNNARDLGRLRGDVRQHQPQQLVEDLKRILADSQAAAAAAATTGQIADDDSTAAAVAAAAAATTARDAELAEKLDALMQSMSASSGAVERPTSPMTRSMTEQQLKTQLQQHESLREWLGQQHDAQLDGQRRLVDGLLELQASVERRVAEAALAQEKAIVALDVAGRDRLTTLAADVEVVKQRSEVHDALPGRIDELIGARLDRLEAACERQSSMSAEGAAAMAAVQAAVIQHVDESMSAGRRDHQRLYDVVAQIEQRKPDTSALDRLVAAVEALHATQAGFAQKLDTLASEAADRQASPPVPVQLDTSAIDARLAQLSDAIGTKTAEVEALDRCIRERSAELAGLEARGERIRGLCQVQADRVSRLLQEERAQLSRAAARSEEREARARAKIDSLAQRNGALVDRERQRRERQADKDRAARERRQRSMQKRDMPLKTPTEALGPVIDRRIVSMGNVPSPIQAQAQAQSQSQLHGAKPTSRGSGYESSFAAGSPEVTTRDWPMTMRGPNGGGNGGEGGGEGGRKASWSKRVSTLFSSTSSGINNAANKENAVGAISSPTRTDDRPSTADSDRSQLGRAGNGRPLTSMRSLRSFSLRT